METVQGYVILKAATFETGHGFALGHNPGAPSPFVTWQFTEGENGHRDYYWGRYGNSLEWAQKDFDRRVDDYQYLYHAAVKNTELAGRRLPLLFHPRALVDDRHLPERHRITRRFPSSTTMTTGGVLWADGRLMAWGELTYAKTADRKADGGL